MTPAYLQNKSQAPSLLVSLLLGVTDTLRVHVSVCAYVCVHACVCAQVCACVSTPSSAFHNLYYALVSVYVCPEFCCSPGGNYVEGGMLPGRVRKSQAARNHEQIKGWRGGKV